MKPEDRVRLEHMIEAARSALRFMAGRTRTDLDTDLMLLFAVVRAVEIVGEAASRVSAAGRAAMPDVPWPAVIGMRNRLIHAYFDIDKEVVWKTVTEELPPLLTALEAALEGK
ncbi:DUF86 domain-containing protein [Betaproteobacteria bacterium PRO7]|jgi:uncharacterized protein with HEPN domain|nr:DUF86 domain-containing protein [Betaproteobacteria bacterium PRO7]